MRINMNNVADTKDQKLTLSLLALFLFTLVVIGRAQELFPVLIPYRIGMIIGIVAIVLCLFEISSGRAAIIRSPELKIILLLSAVAVLSVPMGIWPGNSFKFLINEYLKTVIFFILIMTVVHSLHACKMMTWALVWSGFLLSVSAITSDVVYRVSVSESYGANELALVMVCTLPFAISLLTREKGIKRVFIGICIVLLLCTIVLTISRGGFLGLLAVSLMLLFRRQSGSLFPKLAFIALIILILTVFAPDSFWDRISTILEPTKDYNYLDSTGRIEVWKRGKDLFLQNLFLGVGIDGFRTAEGLFHGGAGKWSAAHNIFIDVAVDLGVFGLALYIGLIYKAVKGMREFQSLAKRYQENDLVTMANSIEIGLYGFIVCGFFLSVAYSGIFFFLIGMAVAVKQSSVDRLREKDRPEVIKNHGV